MDSDGIFSYTGIKTLGDNSAEGLPVTKNTTRRTSAFLLIPPAGTLREGCRYEILFSTEKEAIGADAKDCRERVSKHLVFICFGTLSMS